MTSQQQQTLASGGVAVTKKQKKEQFEALSTLQAQLDVSVSLARNQIKSWMSLDDYPSDDEDTKSVAASEMKARQPGLGLGAKFISHKESMRHVPLSTFETKLKRQMTGGKVAADQVRQDSALPDKYQEHKMMMAALRKEQQEREEEEEDSRTRTISKSASAAPAVVASSSSTSTTPSDSSKGANQGPASMKHHGNRKMPAVHPALLKGSSSSGSQDAAPKAAPSLGNVGASGAKKKRPGDFFSTYMNERAEKLAKKQKKAQAKRDDDSDDD